MRSPYLLILRLLEDRLLLVEFTTVEEYLVKLRWLCKHISQAGVCRCGSLLYLAAAVSDFYIPRQARPQHKLHAGSEVEVPENQEKIEGFSGNFKAGSDGSLTIHLAPVPKVLGLIVSNWAPKTMVVSFKV